jgi:predicted metal-dependent phosphoesterase TrpH
MIDLHLHTTASDGVLSPRELVSLAASRGIDVLSVTDHDTMAGIPEAASQAAALGIEIVSGIEITAVLNGRDVHVLAYDVDPHSPEIAVLLAGQREERADRAREIADLLSAAGAPIDIAPLLRAATARCVAVARPQIARALVEAGHVTTVAEAFEKFLSTGRPCYVPHRGPSPSHVVRCIAAAEGISSLAHPGLLDRDDVIPPLVEEGLFALEAYHSEHDLGTQARYVDLARRYGLALSGGSDFHGNGRPRDQLLGVIGLPREHFPRLLRSDAGARRSADGCESGT